MSALERLGAALQSHMGASTVRISTADLEALLEEHADLAAAVKCVSETSDALLSRAEAAEARLASISGVTREQLVEETKRQTRKEIVERIREEAIGLSKGSRELMLVLAERVEGRQ